MIKEKVITHTNRGIYVVENDELLYCDSYKDIQTDRWVQVDDLSELSESEYKQLRFILRVNYNYILNGRFI